MTSTWFAYTRTIFYHLTTKIYSTVDFANAVDSSVIVADPMSDGGYWVLTNSSESEGLLANLQCSQISPHWHWEVSIV